MKTYKYYFYKSFTNSNAEDFVSWLDKLNTAAPGIVELHINSYGGSVSALLSMLAAIKRSHHKVNTVASGAIMSCGFVLFICGAERTICNNTMILSHKPWSGAWGNEDEMKAEVDHMKWLTNMFVELYEQNGKLSKKEIRQKVLRREDVYLTAREMKKYGYADKVV